MTLFEGHSEFRPSVYDAPASRAAKVEAIKRVDRNADEGFKEAAFDAVIAAANKHPHGFIVDQVWASLPDDVDYPREGRVMGAVMLRAQRAGIIAPTEQYRPSAKVTSHSVPRRVWVKA